jgi:hypothetical protein
MLNAVVVANAVKGKIDTKDKGRLEKAVTVVNDVTGKAQKVTDSYKPIKGLGNTSTKSNPVNSPKKTNSVGNA